MNKYLITYLIGTFDGRGVDVIRIGLDTVESTSGFVDYVRSLALGYWKSPDTIIMPGAILSVKQTAKASR